MDKQIISLRDWFETPPGHYLLEWERTQFDSALADIFGYHALQLGLPELPLLQANRMPHRWAASAPCGYDTNLSGELNSNPGRIMLATDYSALPFPRMRKQCNLTAAVKAVHSTYYPTPDLIAAARLAVTGRAPVTVRDLAAFSDSFGDLDDPQIMKGARE